MNRNYFLPLLLSILLFQFIPLVLATPNNGVSLTTDLRKIEVSKDQSIHLDIYLNNNGEKGELVNIIVKKPLGWEVSLKSHGYVVKSIYLDPKEKELLVFDASPKLVEENQTYTFKIEALNKEGLVEDILEIQAIVTSKTVGSTGISLSTPYPSIEGPSGRDFEFTVTVKNGEDTERVIDFSAYCPPQWLVTFKPRFETKQVRSLYFKTGETKTLTVTVSPPPKVKPGTYNVKVVASSGPLTRELNINVTITGTYKLKLTTSNGLLSMDAVQGEESYLTLQVNNTGTGTLKNIHFTSEKPVGWDVKFEPNEIPSLPPEGSREVRVTVKPPSDAIPGDYLLTLTASSETYSLSDSVEIRVTVLKSLIWGAVGVGVIIATILALLAIFWRLGRR